MDVRTITSRTAALLFSFVLVLSMVAFVPFAFADHCGPSQHPSGKDKCDEPGGSGTQGKARSDPDDDGRGPDRSNGGADKPGGPGGVNLNDQDGNNGCGNDQDFEDDNEGWCGGKPKPQVGGGKVGGEKPKPDVGGGQVGKPKPDVGGEVGGGQVGGITVERPPTVLGERITRAVGGGDVVLGARVTRPAAEGAPLPFTGAAVIALVGIAVSLIGAGSVLATNRRP